MKKLRYLIEAALAYALYGLFKILPLDTASALGGAIGRLTARFVSKTKKARRRVEEMLPGKTAAEYDLIIRDMWDNLGRVFAEYPHLKQIGAQRVKLVMPPSVEALVAEDNGIIFYSIHAANWEIASASFLEQHNLGLIVTYRAPNNPYVEHLLYRSRCYEPPLDAYPKARESGRKLMSAVREGRSLGFMIDQKYNEGIALDFFGKRAMSNPIHAQLALKFDKPLVAAMGRRLAGKKVAFEIVLSEPISLKNQDGETRNLEDIMEECHITCEDWIKKHPGSWLWLHNRWG